MGLVKIGTGRYVINEPGSYELSVDETNSTNDPFLTIAAHYVTARLRGRMEGNLGASSNAAGVYCNGFAQVSVLGEGVLLRGFKYGVQFINCYRTAIRELGILDMAKAAITHTGADLVCERNQIKNTGGGVGNERVFGIRSLGGMPTIVGNVIRDTFNATEEAVGISSDNDGDKGLIAFNSLMNAAGPGGNLPNGLPNKWGIWLGGLANAVPNIDVVHNHLNGWGVCYGFASSTEGLLDENSERNYNELYRLNENWQIGGTDG